MYMSYQINYTMNIEFVRGKTKSKKSAKDQRIQKTAATRKLCKSTKQ
ncbi:unnamed protein product [Brugia timori]|uniref:Ovule protein n=1 Tax=Brugia timori TaxID=42155 RepID=A0A0R3QS42_9BILA|nr:unnamed protein product [Brugia timori]